MDARRGPRCPHRCRRQRAGQSRRLRANCPIAPTRQSSRQRARRWPLRRPARDPRRHRNRRPSPRETTTRALPGRSDRFRRRRRTALHPGEALAYLEVHIEQGPYLESVAAPVGVVTAISGQSRILAAFNGEAGHAGTVGMHLRRDPLPAAAEIVLAAENLGRHTPGLLATVGTIEVTPGASNVIPGQARFSVDVRHPEDAVRTGAVSALERRVREVAATRSLGIDWHIAREHSAVFCDASLAIRLAEA